MSTRNATRWIVFLMLFLFTPLYCFSPLPMRRNSPRSSFGHFDEVFLRGTKLSSTTDMVGGNEQQEVAIQALERLLDKQRADVEETEKLLSMFDLSSGNVAVGTVDVDNDGASTKSSAIAASIFSGVDYGFISRSEGPPLNGMVGGLPFSGDNYTSSTPFEGYGPPANLFILGAQQFKRNLDAIRGEYRDEPDTELSPKQKLLQEKLKKLTLNSTAIWERETADGPIEAPLVLKIPYIVLCYFLDVVFEGRYVPSRFFLLETVARVPYFSYISMLHLYETLGFWRRSADIKRIHFAEEWNEFHHLLIMESLGGDQAWWVRFLAQHSAIVYYWVLNFLWVLSPTLGYKFSELLETHAVNTYGQLLDENEDLLKDLPPSLAAVEYYSFGASDPFFGEYQTTALASGGETRQPGEQMRTLYDVFSAIRADEGDHVSTMIACLDPNVAVASPSLEKKVLSGVALAAAFGYLITTGEITGLDGFGDLTDGINNILGIDSAGDVLSGVVDGAGDDAAATAVVDSVVAGIAALTQRFVTDEEQGDLVGLGEDLVEGGAAGAAADELRRVVVDFLKNLLQFVSKLRL